MRRLPLTVLVIAVVISAGGLGRSGPWRAGPPIIVKQLGLVSADAPRTDHAEAWLSIDPTNPARAVVVAIAGSGSQSVVYTTSDAGKSWRRGSHIGPEPERFPGLDPVAAFGHDGSVYFATVSPFRVWRSGDGGASWQGPAFVPGRSYDWEFLAVRSGPNGRDTIYAVAKTPIKIFGHLANDVLALSRSIDGGQTFEAPRLLLPDPTKSIIHIPGSLLVTPDGRLLLSVMTHDVPVADPVLIKNHVWILRSDDGGRTFADPVPAVPTVVHGNRGDLLKMGKSLAPAALALDTAQRSPYRGRLYLSFLSVVDNRLQVMVATSNDTGRTWTPAIKVNDDSGSANHSNPAIAIDDQGAVAVLWNDRRADPSDLCFRATVSASVDGGATYLPSVPLVANGTCPLGRGGVPPYDLDSFRGRYLNGGETQGLAPLPGGKFLVVFIDEVAAALQLRSATIEVSRASTSR
ncbi:MAG: sialidase family protein [Gemmatimonadota bacterium]